MGAQDDKSYLTSIAIGFSIAITVIAVSLRLLARKLHKIPIGADDYAIIVGAVFTIGDSIVFIFTNKYGNGRHFDTIQPDNLTRYWTTFYASFQLYGVAITAIKISVLLFYRRVFSTAQFRRWIYGVGALVIIWLLFNNLMAAFQCTPPEKYYKQELPGHCINPLAFVKWIQVPNIILDVIILTLPVPAVLHLQMSRMRKASVLAIFLLGGLSCIIAIIRLVVLVNSNLEDITYGTGKASWTLIEPAIEVLSACLPTMAPFLSMSIHWPNLRSSLRSLLSSSRHRSQSEIDPRRSFNDTCGRQYGVEVKSQASGRPLKKQAPESDEIPLRSIQVRQDLVWTGE